MAFTVTATMSGTTANEHIYLTLKVLTGAAEAGGASAAGITPAGGSSKTWSLTPAFGHSLPVWAISGDTINTPGDTPATSNTLWSDLGDSDTWIEITGFYSGTTVAATPVTLGVSTFTGGGGADYITWASYEVGPSVAGVTPAVDGSSPAVASATGAGVKTVTTASFTPPAGSVLAACVVCGGSGSSGTMVMTMTDTSGLGLTWTQRAGNSPVTDQSTFVFTATVPGAAGAPYPVAAARPGKTWRRRFHHTQQLLLPPPPPPVVNATAGVATASAVAPAAGAPRAVIAGLGGTGTGFFADQGGNPRMVLGDAVWGLPGNAGRWSSGAWQSDFDTYTSTRAGQGFTAIYTKPMGTTQNGGINDDGRTFDGLFPFQGGTLANPSTGLTSSYWARIDYFLNSALAAGLTVFLNAIGYDSDFETSGPLSGKSASEFQSFGAALGARYASQVNLIWMVADDYFGSSDTKIDSFLTGLRGAGANQPISIENFPESDSRQDVTAGTPTAWGAANAQFNFCYSYNVTYYAVEKAYLESSPICVITGDGYFYQGGSSYAGGSGAFAYDRAIRQDAWHAISSGARGIIHGDEACWQWASTAQASATNNWYQKNNAGNIRALMESLPNWHLLIPDTSSLLVTAGRGTHATGFTSGGGGGQYEVAFTDSYVSASRTAAGDLAVIYLSHATTITIDQTKMVGSYQAFWVDPITGAKTPTTTGTTYNSATPGNNSQGDPDWVLVLQAPGSGVTASAGVATASAVAPQPAVAETVTAGVPAAAAAVTAPRASVSPSAGAAAGTGTALPPAASVAPGAIVATGTAVSLAPQAAAGISAGPAAGTGTALAPVPAAGAIAAVAPASAIALPATVTTSGSTNAPAGVAAAAATAPGPQVAITAAAGIAAGTGTAPAPRAAIALATPAASGLAGAPAPVPALAVLPAAGTGLATAPGATVQTGNATNASAGVATASALALGPAKAVTFTAAAARGLAAALAASVPSQFTVGTLTASAASSATLTAATQRTGGPS